MRRGVYASKRDLYEPCTMDRRLGEDKKKTENITRKETQAAEVSAKGKFHGDHARISKKV